ncbi:MAG: lipoprotein signal peptidase [Paramuribaculum sp.]|nr:lipoprotein signal peptidase [Paramuribaculum sp.]
MKISKGYLALIIIVAVVIIDQLLKIWVKTHFYIGESYHITDWFQIYFIENNGMAFGMEIGSKLILTLFRLILASLLIWYIIRIKSRKYIKAGFIACLSLVVAGALGNIIDCMFYGIIFPAEPGFDTLFHGRVVDMLYFPLFSFVWPDWLPLIGGEEFSFFPAIFNFADAAISVGMIAILLFYPRQLTAPGESSANVTPDNDSTDTTDSES